MKEGIKNMFRQPFFLYLLPIFFVLHGFTENYYLVPLEDSLFLVLKYISAIAVFHLILFFLFRNNHRASFFLFVLLVIYYFFGAFHDAMKSLAPGTFLTKYGFLLPFILLIIVSAILILRKKRNLSRPATYLNTLFLLLIVVDLVGLTRKASSYDRQHQLKSISKELSFCDTCERPDVYLIVTDEYAGEKTLNDLYNFDNSAFLDQLKKKKFQIIKNSISNYNITPISVASILNLNYIDYKGTDLSDIAMMPVYNLIDTNILVPFFRFHGYEFMNNSVFTVYGQPPLAVQSFTPTNTRIIESQTLINRLMRDLGYHLIEWHILKKTKEDDYTVLKNNKKIIHNIKQQALRRSKKPMFSYSHLTMPHSPYYFDRYGKPYPPSDVVEGSQWLDDHYLEYLLYSNGVLNELMDFILKHSERPPVIILVGDHGFRHYSKKVHEEYDFYNLNASFLPERYQANFKDSLSNISYMRTLLNVLFNQQLPIDKQDRYYIPIPIRHNLQP